MFYTYVILNDGNGRIYTGHTAEIEKRMMRHNGLLKNKLTSFTSRNKGNGQWKLIHIEEFQTRKEAMARERWLKNSRGRVFIKNLLDMQSIVRP